MVKTEAVRATVLLRAQLTAERFIPRDLVVMAEIAIAGSLFADILRMIGELRPPRPPVTSTA
jgi:hypothetical protein